MTVAARRPARPAPILVILAAALAGLTVWALRVNAGTALLVDESVYLWQARGLAHGRLSEPAPAHPEFVNVAYLPIHEGRRFGQYPIGFPLALAPWLAAGAPWGLNVALGVAAVALLYLFALRVAGRAAALLSAGLLLLSPFFVAQSTILMSHPLALALTLAALVALERRDARGGSPGWCAAAGAAAGYALTVSPLVAVPIGLVAADRFASARAKRPWSLVETAAFAAPLAAGAAAFLWVNAATTGSPFTTGYDLNPAYTSQRLGFGANIGEGGFTPAMGARNTLDRLASLNAMLFGWPVTSFLFAAPYLVWACLRGARKNTAAATGAPAASDSDGWDRPLGVLLAATVGAYVFWFFTGTGESFGPRYYYPAIPALVLFTARGALAAHRFAASRGAAGRLAVPALLLVLTAAGTVPSLVRLAEAPMQGWRRGTRAFLAELSRGGVARGTIFVEAPGENSLSASLLNASGFEETGPLVFAFDRGPDEDERFLAARPEGPVYWVKPRMATQTWKLHDRPVWERQAAPEG